MPLYRVNYGESYEFMGQTPVEVVHEMKRRHLSGSGMSEERFMRRAAMEMCEWNGKNYYFCSKERFAKSMIDNGLLEIVD